MEGPILPGELLPALYIEPPYCTEYKHNSQSVAQISGFIRAAVVLTWCVEPRTVGLLPIS